MYNIEIIAWLFFNMATRELWECKYLEGEILFPFTEQQAHSVHCVLNVRVCNHSVALLPPHNKLSVDECHSICVESL